MADDRGVLAPIRRGLAHRRRTDQRNVTNGAASEFIDEMLAAILARGVTIPCCPRRYKRGTPIGPGLPATDTGVVGSGRTPLLRYDGDGKLHGPQIDDGTMALCSGDHRAMIESDHLEGYDCAGSYYVSIRTEATPISADSFADESPVEGRKPVAE